MRRQLIFRAGNSLAISIPARLVKRLRLERGQQVKVEVDWNLGTMKVSFPDGKQLTLDNS